MNMYVYQYELFKIDVDESIKNKFAWFTNISNNLKSLGKTYQTSKQWDKSYVVSLRISGGPKVIAIEEVQDLKKQELDDLLGKLLIHEIHLKEDEGENSKKETALKYPRKTAPRDRRGAGRAVPVPIPIF